MNHAHEQVLVEKLVRHADIKALDKNVLIGSAWNDVMPILANLAAPCWHRIFC